MASRFGCHCGGTLSLHKLIKKHGEAIEYDLIQHGLRLDDLGSGRLSWRDLKVIVTRMPPQKSALQQELASQDAGWTLTNHLLAEAVDSLHLLLWAKTKDGYKNRNRPHPIQRPGRRRERLGKQPLGISEIRDWLGWS
jgi:hypothetical protein